MAAKVKLSLGKLSTSQLIGLSQQITGAMTGNPDFPTPNPPLATIVTATGELETASNAVNTARIESKNRTIVMNEQADKLRALLSQLGSYVENIAGGKQVLITGAGMDVQAARSNAPVPDVLTGFEATTGDSDGEINLGWNSLAGAVSYVVERSLNAPPNAAWEHQAATTKSNLTVEGLTSGARYWFRVAAVGTKGQGGWSDISTRIAP